MFAINIEADMFMFKKTTIESGKNGFWKEFVILIIVLHERWQT